MRKLSMALILVLTISAFAADRQLRQAPILALRQARQGYENIIWMEQRIKIGGESVNGYLQGTGGSDDALMGLAFEEDWDMLTATVGFKDSTPEGREAEFSVESGGTVLFRSGVLESKGAYQKIRVPIRGRRQILLRISSDQYNGTAGASWGEPMVLAGLTEEEMKSDWSISVNNRKSPLPGNNAPSEVLVPFSVPMGGTEQTFTVKIHRDTENRTVIVEKVEN